MKNIYIPEVLKEKILSSFKYAYAFLLFSISVISALSLFSFNINDNSFLTNTSGISQNLLGDFGSYYASFIFYTFGILGYMIIIFFLIYSVLVTINKSPKYIFIRLLLFFISLVFIPQAVLVLKIKFFFIESIETWGVFSLHLYSIYEIEYIGYAFSIVGIFIYGFSQNLIAVLKLPRFKINQILREDVIVKPNHTRIKKDPIIKNISNGHSNEVQSIQESQINEKSKQENAFFSPSLEILVPINSN